MTTLSCATKRRPESLRLTLLLAFALLGSASCSPGELSHSVPLSHLPGVLPQALKLGPVDASTPVVLRIVLPLRNEDGLDKLIDEMYDPKSTSYHQFLTPESFAAQFHPSPASVAQVRHALAASGIQTAETAHGAVLEAVATVGDIEAFVQAPLYHYAEADGTQFVAPASEVHLPDGLPIRAITGLHTAIRYRSDVHIDVAAAASTVQTFSPAGIRQGYSIPAALDGSGQIVGLVELDGYLLSDLTGFAKQFGLPSPDVQNFLLDGFSGVPGNQSAETTVDIEMVMGMAPGAQLRVYEGMDGSSLGVPPSMDDIFNEMANPTLGDRVMPTIVSCSWFYLESQASQADVAHEQTILKQMVAQGQTIFASSGDRGADADGTGQLGVEGPASEPYVVAVGGTLLTTDAAGTYQRETAWSGSGGGISKLFTVPTYQAGLANASNKASGTMRNVPDVSIESGASGGGFSFNFEGRLQSGFGTSASAPLWAGYLSLANQLRAQRGLGRLGFINPVLYRLASGSQYNHLFHDINDNSSNGFYPAVTGYDDATGLGSMNGGTLLTALAQGYARHIFVTPPPKR